MANCTFLSLEGEDSTSKLVGGRTRTLSAELMFTAITHSVSSWCLDFLLPQITGFPELWKVGHVILNAVCCYTERGVQKHALFWISTEISL